MPSVSRVGEYTHLTPADLEPPGEPEVFFEPADTEMGVWVAADLLPPGGGGTVLDLGSGSGAAAAAMVRAGAARAHGVDSGRGTLRWAERHYASPDGRVTFALGDYSRLGAQELLATVPGEPPRPLIVTSNPAYVPLPPEPAGTHPSISGGPDGLKWAGAIIGHARTLRADLGLTIGSYSTPRRAVALLAEAGYRVAAVTLCPLPLGEFTLRHPERVLDLEERGEAVLWRSGPDPLAYFVVGLACRRAPDTGTAGPDSAEELMDLLHAAARSATSRLETLDAPGGTPPPWPVRVLDLPPAAARHHW
ncbi:methyltransferase domain-containing protein [Streptomyces sp. 5-8]|uniref:Methyltransferase domain-containing protein n=1 Tax=Streptomyces musisoli TaxID=2802280 RepID=A0ABS1NXF1_9ACTN|nr:methyltransferase domain-containing protein [Streptomyces musisoli]MBL1104792.1 methyltransferase domain-containing protein [Streptomyces musisoli]